jgi:DNA-binding XRE family transcriptional regulator
METSNKGANMTALSTTSTSEITPDLQGQPEAVSGSQSGVISPSQLKAARGLLNWTRAKCGKEANVSPETIKNIEHETFTPLEATNKKLIDTFAAHGVELINLVNFRLHTLSGNELDRVVNVTGAVLITPASVDGGTT